MEHRNIVLALTETPLKHRGKEEAEESKEVSRNAKTRDLRVYVSGATL
jgi:hypothetical protein